MHWPKAKLLFEGLSVIQIVVVDELATEGPEAEEAPTPYAALQVDPYDMTYKSMKVVLQKAIEPQTRTGNVYFIGI